MGVTYIPWEKVKVDDLDDFAEGGIIDQETVNDGKVKHIFLLASTFSPNSDIYYFIAEWEAAKNAETAKENATPVTVDTTPATNTQTETFNQQVTMMPVQVRGLCLPQPQEYHVKIVFVYSMCLSL